RSSSPARGSSGFSHPDRGSVRGRPWATLPCKMSILAQEAPRAAPSRFPLLFCSVYASLQSYLGANFMDLSIKGVPEERVPLLRERAKANHRSLQGELRALIDAATSVRPQKLSVDEIAVRIGKLGLQSRDEAVRLIREDRDR